MKIKTFFHSLILSFTVFFSVQALFAEDLMVGLKALPVQDAGRIKPFDTFARESLNMIYGREVYQAVRNGPGGSEKIGEKKGATEIVMTWMLQPEAWQGVPLFELSYGELKSALKLPKEEKYFSYEKLMNNDNIANVMQELASRREAKEKLNPYYQAVQRLETQLITFREIAAGRMLRLLPTAPAPAAWLSLAELQGDFQAAFIDITKNFISVLAATTDSSSAGGEKAVAASQALSNSVQAFEEKARAAQPDLYPALDKVKLEVHYNNMHPFKWAWIIYLLSALTCLVAWAFEKKQIYPAAWAFIVIGFLFHIYGFVLRVYLTERPPVSNMYETVVWVGFGTVLFAMIIEAVYRWRFILLAGAMVGAFCLALADMAPAVLDGSLQPLEPVLRNNFWLMVHVLTITISYAAFFLAFAMGNMAMIYYFKSEQKYRDQLKAMTLAIYRAVQVGVSLLAPGIILGGVWADYSWGRFWGWDPKETWALIVLLGYMAVLHGRLVGMVKDFGMAAAAVIAFNLVIMAWYGVNFVLGAGLHSYGFGAGGVEYVATFCAINLLLVIFVSTKRQRRS